MCQYHCRLFQSGFHFHRTGRKLSDPGHVFTPGFHAGIVDIGRKKLGRVIGNGFLSIRGDIFLFLLPLLVNMVVSFIVAIVVAVIRVGFLRFFRFVAAVTRSAVLPNIL